MKNAANPHRRREREREKETHNAPLVSVIVLTYNQEEFLKQTLDSIVGQNFPREQVEIVVGEDASSDQTAQILKDYAARYANIFAIFNPRNLGIVDNFINVINHCRGKYIMGCGGDDYYLPGKIQKQVDFMEKNPHVLMCFGNWYCLENGKFYTEERYTPTEDFESLLYSCNINAPSACWRRAYWQSYLNEINPQQHHWGFEDYPLWLYLAQKGKIKHLDENFCVYRILQGSASRPVQNFAKTLKILVDQWQVRCLFTQKFLPEKFPQKEQDAIATIFDSAFQMLLQSKYSPYISQIVWQYAKKKTHLSFKQKLLVCCAQVPFLWNVLYALLLKK